MKQALSPLPPPAASFVPMRHSQRTAFPVDAPPGQAEGAVQPGGQREMQETTALQCVLGGPGKETWPLSLSELRYGG